MNNELTELHFEEKREIEKILRELASQLTKHLDPIRMNIEILAELDFIQAKARYALEINSVKPFLDKDKINLINAYHPVLLQTHKKNEVVPLNLTLGDEYNTLVISGPNAGGKTVVLKTVCSQECLFRWIRKVNLNCLIEFSSALETNNRLRMILVLSVRI